MRILVKVIVLKKCSECDGVSLSLQLSRVVKHTSGLKSEGVPMTVIPDPEGSGYPVCRQSAR